MFLLTTNYNILTYSHFFIVNLLYQNLFYLPLRKNLDFMSIVTFQANQLTIIC